MNVRSATRLGSLLLLAAVPALLTVPAAYAADARASEAVSAGVRLVPVRSQWPVAREASGRWGVLGETLTIHAGSRPTTIKAVRLRVKDQAGAPVADRLYKSRRDFRGMLAITTQDAEGRLVVKPLGTTRLDPGDVGLAFLNVLAEPHAVPASAEITVAFENGTTSKALVPLFASDPGQRMSWPLSFANGPWLAVNTLNEAGSPFAHWSALYPTPDELFISQRFAVDCVQIDSEAQTSSPPASPRREDYYAWGEEILSAGSGQVVAVVGDQADQEVGSSDPAHPGGNYVVIRYGPQLYGFYAHMMLGSAVVAVGDSVETGQVIGRVGNSGNTTEPHLHFHLVDRWDGLDPVLSIYTSQGLPASFWNAHVRRGSQTLPMEGAIALEFDLIEP